MKLFIELLNEVRVGNIDDIEKLLKARFVHESDENYSKYVLNMYTETEKEWSCSKRFTLWTLRNKC